MSFENLPLTLLGCVVRVVPDAAMPPVLQISHDFPHCSPEFRAAWNQWALERFGREDRILFMQIGATRIACMTKRTSDALRRQIGGLAEDMVMDRDYQLRELRRAVGLINPRSIVSLKGVT